MPPDKNRTPTPMLRSRQSGLRIERDPDFPAALAEELVHAPEPSAEAVLKEGRRGRIYRHASPLGTLCIKELRPRGLGRMLLGLVRPDGNRVAWRAAQLLSALQFSIAKPWALIEAQRGPLVQRSLFVSQFLEDARRLDDLYREITNLWSPARQRRFVVQLADFMRAFHELGIYHRDLAPQNVLVEENGTDWRFFLVDLESVRLNRRLTTDLKVHNLVQLSSMYPDPYSFLLRQRFLRAYAGGRSEFYNSNLMKELRARVLKEREYCRRWYIKDYGHDPQQALS